jgi:methylenetetrahydrofolate dehydrogenase (NADP+) / methenyltetrahydrofolate cyclohydrolase
MRRAVEQADDRRRVPPQGRRLVQRSLRQQQQAERGEHRFGCRRGVSFGDELDEFDLGLGRVDEHRHGRELIGFELRHIFELLELRDGCMSAGAMILDGNALAARLLGELEGRVQRSKSAGVTPCLAVVLVGDDPASKVYVRSKERRAAAIGIETRDHRLAATTTTEQLVELIARLNADDAVHGILVQLPLPAGVDEQRVLRAVDPRKDVDGFHPDNLGLLMLGAPRFVACTPQGCMRLIEHAKVELSGARALVIGRSNIVGKPVAQLLLQANATVTIAHSRTRDLEAEVRRAEVVVAAVGRPEMIRGEWIREGACVIDVGINRVDDGGPKPRLVGDVEFAPAAARAGAITPVPGGVGPMTIACLLANVVDAAEVSK